MSKFNANSRAKTRCYIINNETNKKLTFQFNPTQIPYGRSATYATIDSPGMSYPLTQYVGGQVREFSFDVFYYDYTGKNKSGGTKINKARSFLEALLPPEENNKKFTKPPTFTLAYGYFVKTLVLLDLQVNDEWIDENGNPIMTTFSLTVRQVGKS